MENPQHTLSNLFAQLGLLSEPSAIAQFIAEHSPLPPAVSISEASFWTPSQAGFLKEEILNDADWAEVIDELNEALRA